MDDFKNLKNLTQMIDLCRKKGVESIKIDGLELTLRPEAPPSNYKRKLQEVQGEVPTENPYTEEDAIFWSSAGIPEEKAS